MTTSGTTPAQSIEFDMSTPEGVRSAAEMFMHINEDLKALGRTVREMEARRERLSMLLLGQENDRKDEPNPVLEDGAVIKIGPNDYVFEVGSRNSPALRQAWDAIYNTFARGSEEQQKMDTAMENSKSTSYLAKFTLRAQ